MADPALPRSCRGRLVVVEGPDRAGKTTLARALAADHGYVYVKLPDRSTATGQVLHRFIAEGHAFSADHEANETAAQLVFAANNHEKRAHLLGLLESGRDVVLDRFLDSAVVYHSAAVGEDRAAWILALNQGMPLPDLVLVLELPFEAAAKRADMGKERNDSEKIQTAVARGYRARLDRADAPWPAAFLDATASAGEVLAEAVETIGRVLPRVLG